MAGRGGTVAHHACAVVGDFEADRPDHDVLFFRRAAHVTQKAVAVFRPVLEILPAATLPAAHIAVEVPVQAVIVPVRRMAGIGVIVIVDPVGIVVLPVGHQNNGLERFAVREGGRACGKRGIRNAVLRKRDVDRVEIGVQQACSPFHPCEDRRTPARHQPADLVFQRCGVLAEGHDVFVLADRTHGGGQAHRVAAPFHVLHLIVLLVPAHGGCVEVGITEFHAVAVGVVPVHVELAHDCGARTHVFGVGDDRD